MNKSVKIPITVYSEYTFEEGERFRELRLGIEEAGFIIGSLFSLIKLSTMVYDGLSTDEPEPGFIFSHVEDIRQVSKLGEAVGHSITELASRLHKFEKEVNKPEKETVEKDQFSDVLDLTESAETIALALSSLLDNPNLPEPVYDALKTALSGVHNSIDQSEILEFENSPEYIEMILRGYKKREEAR